MLPLPLSEHIWRRNPFWLSILSNLDIIQSEWEHFFRTDDGSASAGNVWDAFKLHARMILSTHINRHKATSKVLLRQSEDHLHMLEQTFQSDPTAANATLVRAQSRLTEQLHVEKAKQGIFFNKQRIFEHGERAGKLLAYMAHLEHKPPVIVSLQSASGTRITDPDLVAEEFRSFYSNLYCSTARYSQQELLAFLQGIDFPTLTPSQIAQLDAPITTDCIAEALAQLPASKASGSDGLPLEFYNQFGEILVPKLCKLYSHIFDTDTLPASMGEALIVLIPKPGKDPHLPESYRPISLLQLDVKILAKILAQSYSQSHPPRPNWVYAQQKHGLQSQETPHGSSIPS